MTDTKDTKAETAEPQQSAMPTEDKKGSGAEVAQDAAPVTEEATEVPTSELPEDAKQRTREQFDKLKGEKEALQQELNQHKQVLKQPPQPEKETKLYDPTTGLVDTNALNKLGDDIASLKRENANLRQEAGNKEVTELLNSHPELDKDNKDKFNQELFDEATRLWMHSLAYPDSYGGRALTQEQAAVRAKKKVGKKETPEQQTERETVKEQASLGISGKPGQGVKTQTAEATHERLVMGTRLNQKGAMIERMRNIRVAKEKKGGE